MDKSYIKMSIPGLDASLESVCVCECGDALKIHVFVYRYPTRRQIISISIKLNKINKYK